MDHDVSYLSTGSGSIKWDELEVQNVYVSGDQWGPLVKLYFDDYEVHLHMNATGKTVQSLGSCFRLDRSSSKLKRVSLASSERPSLERARERFNRAKGLKKEITYHQDLVAAGWTLEKGTEQPTSMRGHKDPYKG